MSRPSLDSVIVEGLFFLSDASSITVYHGGAEYLTISCQLAGGSEGTKERTNNVTMQQQKKRS